MIDFHQYLGPAYLSPSGERVAIDGEHGGFGFKVANHMWFGDGHAYEMEPGAATLTGKYVGQPGGRARPDAGVRHQRGRVHPAH
ncbi:hypothetical protein [Krasilnikovia cinnamomea]|uniref:hypothetical protein n=1 Tax=Krasilnikovia cinnamomea TaxID=349313 RepID=UPI001F5EB1F6|nr:hypothetical protein [Krasilnikovia cinnamomea]